MQTHRLVGRRAGVQKYDLLTALSVLGLRGSTSFQTTVLRLMSVITARYNWQRNELCVGQRDMARLWSVTERTAKREIKRLTSSGLLVLTRPGVKGRVATYRLDIEKIIALSRERWEDVGSDYASRMSDTFPAAGPKVVSFKNVAPQGDPDEKLPWGRVLRALQDADPASVQSWFGRLECLGYRDGHLTLRAPSKFVEHYVSAHLMQPLHRAAEPEFGAIQQIAFA